MNINLQFIQGFILGALLYQGLKRGIRSQHQIVKVGSGILLIATVIFSLFVIVHNV